MAVCMKLSPHICDTDCEKATVRKGRNTTLVSLRIPDEWALALKKLSGNYDSVGAYIKERLIEGEALRKR